ncbi:MAG TPA: XdhC family protein, partial [Polyangiaceae bacterium]|nr:XdhC family protein [Polyangiaceae bacterium]
ALATLVDTEGSTYRRPGAPRHIDGAPRKGQSSLSPTGANFIDHRAIPSVLPRHEKPYGQIAAGLRFVEV